MDTKPQPPDAALFRRAAAGDVGAFESIALRYEKYVYNLARRVLYNPEDAKDAAQEIMIKIFKNLRKCRDANSLTAWIGKISVNTCLDELRRRKTNATYSLDLELETEDGAIEAEIPSGESTPEEILARKETAGDIRAALDTLAPEHKALVVLRDIYGYSYTEMADFTGVDLGTVKSRLNRARLRLRKILDQREVTV